MKLNVGLKCIIVLTPNFPQMFFLFLRIFISFLLLLFSLQECWQADR